MNKLYTLVMLMSLLTFTQINAQSVEELKAMIAEKEAQVGALSGEIAGLKGQIDALPGWENGAFGTLGFNLSSFNNWFKQALPNSTSSTIAASFNAFANYDDPKHFWRNGGNLNLAWQKLTLDTEADGADTSSFQNIADVLRITSLYGRKVSDQFAISGLLEYNTAVINNFNNPGILDIGVGGTWTPAKNLVVVIHPLNYHIVMGDSPAFNSALGAKLVADYSAEIVPGISWRTNLSTFLPYQTYDPTLFEYTWTNGFAFSVWKGIGVGIDWAIRQADVEIVDTTQSYFIIGLSYAL